MVIRSATPADIGRCSELLGYLFEKEAEFSPDPECQQKGLALIIENPSSGTVLLCEERNSGSIVGMVTLLYTVSTALGKKVALLEDMIVDPAYRSKGIGNMLLRHAINLAKEKGLGRLTLLTDRGNTAAHHLYEKYGFEQSGMVAFRKLFSYRE